MKLSLGVSSLKQLNAIERLKAEEMIINLSEFSVDSSVSVNQFLKHKKCTNVKYILNWDLLVEESRWKSSVESFLEIKDKFDGVRFKDLGVGNWLFKETHLPLQFFAWVGHHNLRSLKTMTRYFSKRLERICLSPELPYETILSYKKNLDCEVEVLLHGKIPLLLTPRKLLSAQGIENKSVNADSLEGPHKKFSVVENSWGSVFYHFKIFSLFRELEKLNNARIDSCHIELDCLDEASWESLDHSFKKLDSDYLSALVEKEKITRGYFNKNKSTVLFKKLKNAQLQNRKKTALAEVLEVKKDSYLALRWFSKKAPKEGDAYNVFTPEGKIKSITLRSIKEIESDNESLVEGRLYKVAYQRGAQTKSLLESIDA